MSIARLMQMARAGVPSGPVWTDPDLANASYDSVSFSVATEDGTPWASRFNDDGLKMYVIGSVNDAVYEYDLSTEYDISTASYSQSFSISSQEGASVDLFFKPDGTKFYISGLIGDAVYQYSLSTAWDISTASYDSVSFSTASQDTVPYGIFIGNSGTRLYVSGGQNGSIFQYTLSTAWDLSTASYDSISFSVSSQDPLPTGLFFTPSGDKMFMSGVADSVFQYTLSTAWDLSTASYDSVSFSAASQVGNALGLNFKPDGSKMYITDNINDTIYQYST